MTFCQALPLEWSMWTLKPFACVLSRFPPGANHFFTFQIYADVAAKGGALLEEALQALLPGSVPIEDLNSKGDELIAVNTTPYARREISKIPLGAARALGGAAIQSSHDGQAYVLFDNTQGNAIVSAVTTEALAAAKIPSARGKRRILIRGNLKVD